tara:strand:+ start:12868 stop:14358 length:1491 start_codon:yes stop_codon:yes gene_type:complete
MAEEYKIKLTTDASQVTKEVGETSKEIGQATKEQGLFAAASTKLAGAMALVKGGIKKVIITMKTLKGAIAATGVGLLVIALGSLVMYFTKTTRGADKLSEVMAAVGAAVDVVVDRISSFGEAILAFFSGDYKGAIEGMKDTFTGLGDEIMREAKAAADLKKQLNELLDLEREFSVQKAKNNVIIREAEAAALDENIAASTRLAMMKEAMRLVDEQADQEENLLQIKYDAIAAQNALGESTRDDLQEEADAQINLINIRATRARNAKRLTTQISTLEKKAIEEVRMAEFEAEREREASNGIIALETKTISQIKIDDANQTAGVLIRTNKRMLKQMTQAKKEATDEEIELTKANTMNQLQAASQLAGALSSLAGDNKQLAVASAIIDTFVGANKAFAQGGVAGFLTGAAVIAGGLSNVKRIMETDVPGASSGGSMPSMPSATPMGQTIGQSIPQTTNLGDVVGAVNSNNNEPVQAYVISQEVTDAQEANAYIHNQTSL